MDECRFKSKNGRCTKYRKNGKCNPSNLSWCEDQVEATISNDRMCEWSSIFGNEYVYITEEHIQALSEGKVLYIPINCHEYGCFVALKNEEVQNERI